MMGMTPVRVSIRPGALSVVVPPRCESISAADGLMAYAVFPPAAVIDPYVPVNLEHAGPHRPSMPMGSRLPLGTARNRCRFRSFLTSMSHGEVNQPTPASPVRHLLHSASVHDALVRRRLIDDLSMTGSVIPDGWWFPHLLKLRMQDQ